MGHNAMHETSAKENMLNEPSKTMQTWSCSTAKSSPSGVDYTTDMPDEILVKILAYAITPTIICQQPPSSFRVHNHRLTYPAEGGTSHAFAVNVFRMQLRKLPRELV
ncbi:hypothetical protein LTS02_007205 [Friedmanniomyces endolithicus]|nr:hypothetical protein LTS02_007205 [Friedmanniomyces endolithicus]